MLHSGNGYAVDISSLKMICSVKRGYTPSEKGYAVDISSLKSICSVRRGDAPQQQRKCSG
jgi:hypothetical protein